MQWSNSLPSKCYMDTSVLTNPHILLETVTLLHYPQHNSVSIFRRLMLSLRYSRVLRGILRRLKVAGTAFRASSRRVSPTDHQRHPGLREKASSSLSPTQGVAGSDLKPPFRVPGVIVPHG